MATMTVRVPELDREFSFELVQMSGRLMIKLVWPDICLPIYYLIGAKPTVWHGGDMALLHQHCLWEDPKRDGTLQYREPQKETHATD